MVWLTIASSGIVFFEPAPFDALAIGLVVLLPLLGVTRFTPSVVMFIGGWLIIAATGLVATMMAQDPTGSLKHAAITLYLSVAAGVIAALVAADPRRYGETVLSALTIASLVVAMAGIIGYLNLVPPLTEMLTAFGRARGTLKDPNVYGAFLIPSVLYVVHCLMNRPPGRALGWMAALPVLVLGVLVSFSRGAWANLALSLVVFGYLTFVTATSVRRQLSLVLLGMGAIGFMALVLMVALQDPDLSEFVSQRASPYQNYDVAPGGRFDGQKLALSTILREPLGIGGLEFGKFFHLEDPHNVYLSMFLNAGWIGGVLYLTLVLVTLLAGFFHALRRTEVQGLFLVAYAAFVGVAGEGFVVDTDHWRHFFLLMALCWGLMAAPRLTAGPQPAN